MKYKILLAGKNHAIIDDFFNTLSEAFECMTTSLRNGDILNHIQYFQPDALIYCMKAEGNENIAKVINALSAVDKDKWNLILIGDSDSCDAFLRTKSEMVGLTLLKPISASTIRTEITKYLDMYAIHRVEEIAQPTPQAAAQGQPRPQTQAAAQGQPRPQTQAAAQGQPRPQTQAAVQGQPRPQAQAAVQGQPRPQAQAAAQGQPRPQTQAAVQGQPRPQMPPKPQGQQDSVSGDGAADNGLKHILVIDDDQLMLRLIKEELKNEYNVATAISGKVGLNFLQRKKTDLILLDYEMPEEDGPMVLEKLRANPATRNIPVIFLTGIKERDKIKKVLAMKPQGYLLKPISHDMLVQSIAQVIR